MSKQEKKAPQVWGRRSAEFYVDLQEKEVIVAVVTGQRFAGQLAGVDVCDVIVRQDSGLEVLIPKGNIVTVHAATSTVTAE